MEIKELLVELLNEPWAILPSAVQKIMAAIDGEEASLLSRSAPESKVTSGSVAIIPIQGPIVRKTNPWLASAQGISREVRLAAQDESVKGIILDIDSPGGTAAGIQEAADLISGMRDTKPIIAVANTLAASAAYWIASAAREIVVVPSAEVGSIGVFSIHEDESGWLDQAGIKITMVTSAKYKAEFAPWSPLSDEAKAELQRRVNEIHGEFVRSVAAGRSVKASDVEANFGQGRTVRAREAVKRGMADRIGSLDATIERLQGRYRSGGNKAEDFTARDIEEILKASDVPANMAKRLVAVGWSPSDSRDETEGAEADSRDETAKAESTGVSVLNRFEELLKGKFPMNTELKAAQESVEKAFHDFRQANDEALKQKADKGYVDGLLEERITKLNVRIDESRDELKRRLDDQEKARQKDRLFGDGQNGAELSQHVESFSRQMSSVHGSRVALSVEDFRAYKSALIKQFRKGAAGLLPEEQAALRVGIDPDGGYWLTPDINGRIATKLFETSPMRQICSVQSVSSDKLEGIIDNDEADSGWVGEEDTRSETGTPAVGKWSIDVHEQYASPKATQKLLDDAEVDAEAWLTAKIADKLARTENAAFVSGTGVTQPIGFLSTPTPVTTADATRAWGTLQYFPSGASGLFDSVVPGDYLIDMVFGLKAGYRQNASFLMARSTLAGIRKLKDGDDTYLWQPDFGTRQGGTLLGFPIVEAEDMPVIGADSFSIAFGDFRAGYQIVDRMGIRVLRDPFTAKPYVVFYTTKRVGGGLVNSEAIKLFKFAAS